MKKSMNQKSQQGLSNRMDFGLMKRSSFVFQITSAFAGSKKNLNGCFFAFLLGFIASSNAIASSQIANESLIVESSDMAPVISGQNVGNSSLDVKCQRGVFEFTGVDVSTYFNHKNKSNFSVSTKASKYAPSSFSVALNTNIQFHLASGRLLPWGHPSINMFLENSNKDERFQV